MDSTLDVADSALADRRDRLTGLWLRCLHGPGAPLDVKVGLGHARVGRDPECEVRFTDQTLSRVHAELTVTRRAARLVRPEGAKRVWVEGAEVPTGADVPLEDGTLVRLGDVVLVVRTQAVRPAFGWGPAPGRSPAMAALRDALPAVVAREGAALVTGETGTGKEALARALHGARPGHLVPFNCSEMTEPGLARRELFGARRGAYTHAEESWGLVKAAERGTLFLDEVGDLPLATQPLLLRLVEFGTYHRLGDPNPTTAQVRVVAATHVDLEAAVSFGQFRQDLLARFLADGSVLSLPPLHERREDLPDWIDHFARVAGGVCPVEPGFVEAVALYHWPNNLRGLAAAVQHALDRDPERLSARHLPAEIQAHRAAARRRLLPGITPEITASQLTAALEAAPSFAEAARQLGISRDQLLRLRRKHGLLP
ncbi:MAG: sigma 54-interacting transcriptional regulator [Myxococcales bacterium]|nr:sigma 54-interacting transcriptional regulator [Myxococcales bacterium]